jgi:hypothetical protein
MGYPNDTVILRQVLPLTEVLKRQCLEKDIFLKV